jgi:hypothetical protein
MDALEFISNIFASLVSLAWPGLIFALWWFNREHIPTIAKRIADVVNIKFPGGEIRFAELNAKATLHAEHLIEQQRHVEVSSDGASGAARPVPKEISGVVTDLGESGPLTIITSFAEIERILDQVRSYIGKRRLDTNNQIALAELSKNGYVSHDVVPLY